MDGATSHEQLDDVGLIHMNGRVYDPLLARFGTPDPMTENPFSTQGWDRYADVGNSPLNFTDPSGYCFMAVIRSPTRPHRRVDFPVSFGIDGLVTPMQWSSAAGGLLPICAINIDFIAVAVWQHWALRLDQDRRRAARVNEQLQRRVLLLAVYKRAASGRNSRETVEERGHA